MPNIYEGQLSAQGKRFGIVVSRFNELISRKLLEGALDCLTRHGADRDQVDIFWVPGSFEIPVAVQKAAASETYDALLCCGAVIRGSTPHFEYIAAEVTKGIAQVGLQYRVPVAYGVITPDTLEQALERAGTKSGNKGWDAAMSAIEMADLFKSMP